MTHSVESKLRNGSRRISFQRDPKGVVTGAVVEDARPILGLSTSHPGGLEAALGVRPGRSRKFYAELHPHDSIDPRFLRELPEYLHGLAFQAVRDAAEFLGREKMLNDLLRRAWRAARNKLRHTAAECQAEELKLTERFYRLGVAQLRAALLGGKR